MKGVYMELPGHIFSAQPVLMYGIFINVYLVWSVARFVFVVYKIMANNKRKQAKNCGVREGKFSAVLEFSKHVCWKFVNFNQWCLDSVKHPELVLTNNGWLQILKELIRRRVDLVHPCLIREVTLRQACKNVWCKTNITNIPWHGWQTSHNVSILMVQSYGIDHIRTPMIFHCHLFNSNSPYVWNIPCILTTS